MCVFKMADYTCIENSVTMALETDQHAWEEYFEQLCVLTVDIENRSLSEEELEILLERTYAALESLHQLLFWVHVSRNDIELVIQQFQSFVQIINRDICGTNNCLSTSLAIYQCAPKQEKKGVGRPKFVISEDILISFRDLGYTWKEIASMLLVSRWTIKRRVEELGIKGITGYSEISDEQLDQLIIDFRQAHGSYTGRSLVTGHLRSLGLRVQQWRIKTALVRVDPADSRIRWACLVKRRKYQVPGPNSLWHMDGHHSLITWGFVIHGIIDGYSRMIVGLKCATNNRKETVLRLFITATSMFGVPSRIRTDKGGENVLVWQEMENLRGPNRGSFLASTSTRNQRIERLWRDVWMYVCHLFYYTFQGMEVEGILDLDNERHMYILHMVFLPRINQVISSFVAGWNRHPLRTEGNKSPDYLWANGMIDLRNRHQVQISEVAEDQAQPLLEWFGFDPEAPSPIDADDGLQQVELEDVPSQFSDEQLYLLSQIDVLQESNNYGIDIYVHALQTVGNL